MVDIGPSADNTDEVGSFCTLGKKELYRLNYWIDLNFEKYSTGDKI